MYVGGGDCARVCAVITIAVLLISPLTSFPFIMSCLPIDNKMPFNVAAAAAATVICRFRCAHSYKLQPLYTLLLQQSLACVHSLFFVCYWSNFFFLTLCIGRFDIYGPTLGKRWRSKI